jgi:endonuclease YncB( thermonuclease family)
VHIDGTPKDAPAARVRITGIQAMEEHVYTTIPSERVGECHANEATGRLEYLVKKSKGRVQLAAQSLGAHSTHGRIRRQVRVNLNGRWRDAGRIMVGEGHALWLSNNAEWAMNASYSVLSEKLAFERLGIFNAFYCGPGPEDLASLRVWVNNNPPGDDRDEFAKIQNLDPDNPVAIGDWWLRDSGLRRYTFPPAASIPPGGTVTLWSGRGTDTTSDFYWGYGHGVYDNVDSETSTGDGAYLFDPEGDLRAWMIYPCRYRCTDRLRGRLQLTAHPKGTEYVKVKNTSGGPVNLYGYRLTAGAQVYPFPDGTILQDGETLRVNLEGDPAQDTALLKSWGVEGPKLANAGGTVRASTFDYIELACDDWGDETCR